jgi:hypothetical protein
MIRNRPDPDPDPDPASGRGAPSPARAFLAFALILGGAAPLSPALAADAAQARPHVPAAAVAAEPARDPAVVECESAVSTSLRELRGRGVQGVQFTGDARLLSGDGGHLDVKGAGRYQRGAGGAVEFDYSCAFDRATGEASGVVLHDTTAGAAPSLPVWKADLSKLSPQACEAAVADRLQRAHARASGIVFDGGSRSLTPAGEGRSALAGGGRLVRAPGMEPTPFHYRCEFDAAGHLADAAAGD